MVIGDRDRRMPQRQGDAARDAAHEQEDEEAAGAGAEEAVVEADRQADSTP